LGYSTLGEKGAWSYKEENDGESSLVGAHLPIGKGREELYSRKDQRLILGNTGDWDFFESVYQNLRRKLIEPKVLG